MGTAFLGLRAVNQGPHASMPNIAQVAISWQDLFVKKQKNEITNARRKQHSKNHLLFYTNNLIGLSGFKNDLFG
jgi:hypothetical protein